MPSIEEVLERYLEELKKALSQNDWNDAVNERLWKKGDLIRFVAGDPARNETIDGYPEGIGKSGELLFRPDDGSAIRRIFSGEIPVG